METDPEFSEVISQLRGGTFFIQLGHILVLLENTVTQKMNLLSLSTVLPPQTTMTAISTVIVSHTALLLN